MKIGAFGSLTDKKVFNQLYKSSRGFHTENIVLFYVSTNEKKVGFTVSKKIGIAVRRNKVKRRLRAAFSALSPRLKDGVYLFVAKPSLATAEYSVLVKDMQFSLLKLRCFIPLS